MILLIFIFLILSFIFSGYETAFFTLRPSDIERLRDEKKKGWLKGLQKNETALLGTILISNLLVNIAASSLISVTLLNIFGSLPWRELYLFLTSLLTAIFIFIFCEATPKIYAFNNRESFFGLSPLLSLLKKVFSPLLSLLVNRIDKWVSPRRVKEFPTNAEMKELIQLAEREGVLNKEERNILLALTEIGQITISSLLTPRRKIFALDKKTTIEEAIEIAKTIPYSRIPVFTGSINNIIGILYVKDLVIEKLAKEKKDRLTVADVMREAVFFPKVQNAAEALEILRKKGSHLAIVVDEFGEVAGLITLEDILESIFGEIRDEYDISEEELYSLVAEKTYIVSGEIDMRTLNRLFNNAFSDVEEERISAFIARHLKRIPKKGDHFVYKNIHIEVLVVVDKRVERVMLRSL